MKKVFRKKDGDAWGYRLSAPPAEEDGWEEIDLDQVPTANRIDLRLDMIEESYERKLRSFEEEMDRLNAKLLAQSSAAETAGGKPEKVSLCRLFRGISLQSQRPDAWRGADFEKHIVDSQDGAEFRALATHLDSAAGYLVPEIYLPDEFIEYLRAKPKVARLGIRRLTGLQGAPVALPKQTGGATAYWVGENSSITDSDQTVGRITLSPRKLAGMTKVANELVRLASPGAEAFVRQDLADTLALELDRVVLRGEGSQHRPRGVLYASGITTFSVSGFTSGTSVLNFDKAYDMLYQLEVGNANDDSLGFIMHPRQWNQARKNADSAAQPKMTRGAGAAIERTMDGMPVEVTTNLAVGSCILGNWSDCILAEWAGIAFAASGQAGDSFQYDQTWIRATMLVDVGVRHGGSFCVSTGFSATG